MSDIRVSLASMAGIENGNSKADLATTPDPQPELEPKSGLKDDGASSSQDVAHHDGIESDDDDDDAAAIPPGQIDPVYEAKAKILNHAIQQIGMGRYQYQLFIVVGFGWASDNLWPITTSLIFTPIANEFHPSRPPLLSLSQNIGLLAGAVFWGFGADVFGRKMAFSLTLGITAVFGMVAAGAPSFAAIGVFAALWSFGVGGNLPVDSAIFLEFLPASHQYLLTVLSIDWALAQVVATLVAWPLLGTLTCQEDVAVCTRGENMGWRYFMIAMGGLTLLMFVVRFLCFTVYESPKYLMGKGRDEEAVRVVHEVAKRNGAACELTLGDLRACEPEGYVPPQAAGKKQYVSSTLRRRLEKVSLERVRALFATRRLALSTGLIMLVWAFIGLGYPLYNAFLPYIQATRGADFGDGSTYLTYRNSLIIAVLGIPGALLGGLLVETRFLGRKGTLASSTVLTGVFLYGSTTATTSAALLGWNCAFNFTSNIMYAVLYSYTPELFPTPQRGTGNALTATCNRVFGIMAPIVAMFANLETAAPVYTSGALFIAAGLLVLALPFESRGKAAL
ncbi:major facilitator superfamily transporter [Bombardia bombarda]|uniref:Major facilitator superfamily transporter n=1 Tax=Bombardia bombarda TaxID=252184 RepID=A0AA39WM48_9PEZI|nr:major facilitator superfamily transporter [Bombardia bombarda]